jgi:hypothetical protein
MQPSDPETGRLVYLFRDAAERMGEEQKAAEAWELRATDIDGFCS